MKYLAMCALLGANIQNIAALEIVGGLTDGLTCKDGADFTDCFDYYAAGSDGDECPPFETFIEKMGDPSEFLPDNFGTLSFEEAKEKLVEAYEGED